MAQISEPIGNRRPRKVKSALRVGGKAGGFDLEQLGEFGIDKSARRAGDARRKADKHRCVGAIGEMARRLRAMQGADRPQIRNRARLKRIETT